MTSCCRRPPTRSSVATGVTGRCRRWCTVCGRRERCKGGWPWTCSASNRRTAAAVLWRPSMRLGNDLADPLSLLQCHKIHLFGAKSKEKEKRTRDWGAVMETVIFWLVGEGWGVFLPPPLWGRAGVGGGSGCVYGSPPTL